MLSSTYPARNRKVNEPKVLRSSTKVMSSPHSALSIQWFQGSGYVLSDIRMEGTRT